MMQMLAAGGMPILCDGIRLADSDNPRGYYEWERIKQLPQDPGCIHEAEGKAVKVISQLLFALPGSHNYRIIFMERPLPEVIASQAEMIRHRGTTGAPLSETALIAGLNAHLNQVKAWLAQQRNILLTRVEYHWVLRNPAAAAIDVQSFIQRELDVGSMARQADPSLYHQRTAARAGFMPWLV